MNGKKAQLVTQTVAPELKPGEEVQIVGLATIEAVPLGARLANAALTGAAAVASGGIAMVVSATDFRYIVLTTDRLIFLKRTGFRGNPSTVVAEIPREAIIDVGDVTGRVTTAWDLSLAGHDRALRIRFPVESRKESLAIAAELRARVNPEHM